MMDLNEDISSDAITQHFNSLHLHEAILTKHKDDHEIASTYNRGNKPIDGIFISDHLSITEGGYLPFGEAISDHRGIWITIQFEQVLGYNMAKPIRPQAQRLKTTIPNVLSKFQQTYMDFIREEQLDTQIF